MLRFLLALLMIPNLAVAQQTAVFAGGCFWCVESDFESVPGVGDVISGYAGGDGTPFLLFKRGHREAAQIPYDPETVSYDRLLHLFLRSIDVFDDGGQFCDRGDTYRTAIFVDGQTQRAAAEAAIARAEADLGRAIVTPILDLGTFHPARDSHQDYYLSGDRISISTLGVGVAKNEAYKRYRLLCGRDARVRDIWGDAAPFANH